MTGAVGRATAAAAVLLLGAGVAAGCGNSEPTPVSGGEAAQATTSTRPEGQPDRDRDPPRPPRVEPARCPADLARCRTAGGTILYVERVDPDGDGDAHFVLASGQSITAPGISVIDVAVGLRPHPLPGPGDRLSAAGPVETGSYGQSQIEAVEVNTSG